MSFFDPPPVKAKKIQRPIYKFPEGYNRKIFVWIYFGSIVMWTLVFSGIGLLLVFLALPFLGLSIKGWFGYMLVVILCAFGVMFGTFLGSRVIGAIIHEGVKQGDILTN